jgi:F-type H+-transporting ATPase subunit b
MELIQTNALISINATFVIQLISFLIFVAIMNRLMFRPLRDVMAKRQYRVSQLQDDIVAAQDQLAGIEADLAEQKRTVYHEAHLVNEALEEAASHQIGALFEQTREKTMAMRNDAEARLTEQLQAARTQVQDEARNLSTLIMQKILQRRLS